MSAIDGMKKRKAMDVVQKVMNKYSKGFFSDEYWKGVKNIMKAFDKADIDYFIDKSEYGVSPDHQRYWTGPAWQIPNDYKKWILSFPFTDEKGREQSFGAQITAHGAGSSAENPLDRYDISAYVF